MVGRQSERWLDQHKNLTDDSEDGIFEAARTFPQLDLDRVARRHLGQFARPVRIIPGLICFDDC